MIFVPDTLTWIPLPAIPNDPRERFTLTENVICGGLWPSTSLNCLKLNEAGAGWQGFSKELKEQRISSVSWDSPSGIILMGGFHSGDTTEVVTSTETRYSFNLKYDVR